MGERISGGVCVNGISRKQVQRLKEVGEASGQVLLEAARFIRDLLGKMCEVCCCIVGLLHAL